MSSYHYYEYEKAAWLRSHPDATAREIETAFRRIASMIGV